MPCSFPKFLSLWNIVQGQASPRVHLKIAHWLEAEAMSSSPSTNRRLLLMAFRSCGKSTLVGVFCAWLFYTRAETRILVLSADLALARKMVRNVKRIIEKHPLTQHLKPDKADQWGADKFTVVRGQELRDPSMLAKGIATNLTGTRADVIICDDVEVPKTSDNAEKRAQLRERLLELDYILTPNGMQIYVGTPHCWHTIYADAPRPELGEDVPFLNGFSRLVLPVLNEAGESIWPERFPLHKIEAIRDKTGPLHFQSQMMCAPVNLANGKFDTQALQHYQAEVEVRVAQGQVQLTLHGRKIVGVSAWWDPAFGRGGGDRSILAIVYTDSDGHFWLHQVVALTVDAQSGVDEAAQQCQQIVRWVKEFHVRSVALETNGIGKFLPNILRRELGVAGIACGVREIVSRKPKDTRILEAFDVVLARRSLHVHRRVLASPFLSELEDWRPNIRRGHDDCLDAVAGAMSLQPVRLGAVEAPAASPQWVALPRKHKVKSEFNV